MTTQDTKLADRPAEGLAPPLNSLLRGLRRRIRRYVWLQGLAATALTLGLGFWVGLGVDWLFEPPIEVRRVGLAVLATVCGYVLYRLSLRRAFARLTDRNMAVLLERRFGKFEDSLLTTVELSGGQPERDVAPSEPGQEMLAHTRDEAISRSNDLDLRQVFNFAPLARTLSLAIGCVASIVLLAVLAPEEFGFGARRLATLSDEPWPRKTRLKIEGFKNNERIVARGSDLDLLVKAENKPELVVPQVVQVRYRTEDGVRERKNMVREGNPAPGPESFQDFKHTFQGVLSNIRFDVAGGDARLKNLLVKVVDSPAISTILHCEYPAYMRRPPADVPGAGVVALPRGTRITVRATSTKDLLRAQVDYSIDKDTPATENIDVHSRRDFEFTLERLDADKTLSFTLLDTDGIQNRAPIQLSLTAIADEAPQVKARLEGIGSAITPQARLPVIGEIKDDYGVARTWFDLIVDETTSQERPFAQAPRERTELTVAEAIEVQELGLKPGQKLLLGAKAADNHSLPDDAQPRVGQGERFLLDVVTPEALRALLESRELNLRQRFESIMEEVTETRDSLTRLELSPPEAAPATVPEPQAGVPADATASEDAGADETDDNPADRHARRQMRIERALQTSQKDALETRGVAVSFEGIRAELVNNRVDTEELKIRLQDNIADPLKRIADTMFPEWDRRLTALKESLPKAGVAPQDSTVLAARSSVEQADAILVEMSKVRDRMLELESFNEAVELLRQIIASQQQVNEQTKKKRLEKVRNLLEDAE